MKNKFRFVCNDKELSIYKKETLKALIKTYKKKYASGIKYYLERRIKMEKAKQNFVRSHLIQLTTNIVKKKDVHCGKNTIKCAPFYVMLTLSGLLKAIK